MARTAKAEAIRSEAFRVLTENLDDILEMLADSRGWSAAAFKYGVSRTMFWRWRREEPQKTAIDRVNELTAESWMDRAREALEAVVGRPDVTQAEVSAAKEWSNHCRYMAVTFNRDRYGERPSVQVRQSLNIENLHLGALQRFGSVGSAEENRKLIQEAEVVEDDEY